MAIQVDKNEMVSLFYTARNTGLSDVVVSIYTPDGGSYVQSGAMVELGATKEYVYSFKAPPYERIYRAVMDSSSKPLRTTETIVVNPARKSGGMFMKKGEIWTEVEKQTLIEAIRLLNERLGRMDELFSSISAEQRAAEGKTEDKLKELKSDIGEIQGNFTNMVNLWSSFSVQNLTAIEKQHDSLSKITVELSELQKNDATIAQKTHEIDVDLGNKVDFLMGGTSRHLDSLTKKVDSYISEVNNKGRLNDERLPRIIAELDDVRASIEDFKETYMETLPQEVVIRLMQTKEKRSLDENAGLS